MDIQKWYKIIDENLTNVKLTFDHLYKGGIVLDVGGNVGAFTDHVISNHPNTEVHIFEPVTKFKEYLETKYKDTNVTFIPSAVGEEKGTRKIRENGSNWGYNEIVGREGNDLNGVDLITLDDYIQSNITNEIGFIKIDVENYEPFVFKGLKNYIQTSKNLPIIIFEHQYPSPHKTYQDDVFGWLFNYYNEFDYTSYKNTEDIILIPR